MTNQAIDTVNWFLFGKDERDDAIAPAVRKMFRFIIKTYVKGRKYSE